MSVYPKETVFQFCKVTCQTLWNSVDLFGDDPFAGADVKMYMFDWPLAVGFEGCGIRNALKGQNLINIATRYDISHPNPKHHWEHITHEIS